MGKEPPTLQTDGLEETTFRHRAEKVCAMLTGTRPGVGGAVPARPGR